MLVLCRLQGVIYVGLLSLSETHRLIAESFALVNSSLSEGVSTALLEVLQNNVKLTKVKFIRQPISVATVTTLDFCRLSNFYITN